MATTGFITKRKKEDGGEEDLFLMGWSGSSLDDLQKLADTVNKVPPGKEDERPTQLQDVVRMGLLSLQKLLDGDYEKK